MQRHQYITRMRLVKSDRKVIYHSPVNIMVEFVPPDMVHFWPCDDINIDIKEDCVVVACEVELPNFYSYFCDRTWFGLPVYSDAGDLTEGDSVSLTWSYGERNLLGSRTERKLRRMAETGPLTKKQWNRALEFMKEENQ